MLMVCQKDCSLWDHKEPSNLRSQQTWCHGRETSNKVSSEVDKAVNASVIIVICWRYNPLITTYMVRHNNNKGLGSCQKFSVFEFLISQEMSTKMFNYQKHETETSRHQTLKMTFDLLSKHSAAYCPPRSIGNKSKFMWNQSVFCITYMNFVNRTWDPLIKCPGLHPALVCGAKKQLFSLKITIIKRSRSPTSSY